MLAMPVMVKELAATPPPLAFSNRRAGGGAPVVDHDSKVWRAPRRWQPLTRFAEPRDQELRRIQTNPGTNQAHHRGLQFSHHHRQFCLLKLERYGITVYSVDLQYQRLHATQGRRSHKVKVDLVETRVLRMSPHKENLCGVRAKGD
jgi:hypothetical protein